MKTFFAVALLATSSVFSQNFVVDETFNNGVGIFNLVAVNTILELPENKFLISLDSYGIYNGISNARLFVIEEDGSYSSSFSCNSCLNSGATTSVKHSLLANDKIIIAGNFSSYDGLNRKFLAKLNLDGSLDSSFNADVFSPESMPYIFSKIDLYNTDGPIYSPKIYVSGWFLNGNFQVLANPLLRLNFDGFLDESFNLDDSLHDYAVKNFTLLDGGKILLYVDSVGLVRVNYDGSIDDTFISDLDEYAFLNVKSMLLLDSGKILLAGNFNIDEQKYILIRFNADGTFDNTFPLYNYGFDNSVQPFGLTLVKYNDNILFGGRFSSFHDSSLDDFVMLNPDGTLNTSFNGGGVSEDFGNDESYVSCLVPSSGKLLIGGDFFKVNGIERHSLCRLKPSNLNNNSFSHIAELSVYYDKNGYNFSSINETISTVEIYDLAGRLVSSVNVNSQTYSYPLENNSILLYRLKMNDGKIYTGKMIN